MKNIPVGLLIDLFKKKGISFFDHELSDILVDAYNVSRPADRYQPLSEIDDYSYASVLMEYGSVHGDADLRLYVSRENDGVALTFSCDWPIDSMDYADDLREAYAECRAQAQKVCKDIQSLRSEFAKCEVRIDCRNMSDCDGDYCSSVVVILLS